MDTETAELVDGILKKAERQRAIEAAVIALNRRPKRNFPFYFLNLVQVGFWILISRRVNFTATIEGKTVVLFEGAFYITMMLVMTSAVMMSFIYLHKSSNRLVLLLAEELLQLKEELKAKEKS